MSRVPPRPVVWFHAAAYRPSPDTRPPRTLHQPIQAPPADPGPTSRSRPHQSRSHLLRPPPAPAIVLGLVTAPGLSRVMRGMLYGVSPTDPASYVVLTGVMVAVAALALYLPARRASRVDPLEAIGSE